MNNQLITPTEYEALPVEEKDCYKEVWQFESRLSRRWVTMIEWKALPTDNFKQWADCMYDEQDCATRIMYAPIIPIKEEFTVTRFTMSEDLILKKNDIVAAVFCDSELATEVINYLNRK